MSNVLEMVPSFSRLWSSKSVRIAAELLFLPRLEYSIQLAVMICSAEFGDFLVVRNSDSIHRQLRSGTLRT